MRDSEIDENEPRPTNSLHYYVEGVLADGHRHWVSNGGRWEWSSLGGWTIRKQTNKQSETMIFNIAVTQLPTPLEVQQENRQEKMIVAPDTILARDQNIATVVFGAKHAKEILAANPDLLQLHVRQGV